MYYEAVAKSYFSFLGVLVILIGGISAYGIKFMGEASKTVDQISKKSSRVSTKRDNKVNIDDKEPFFCATFRARIRVDLVGQSKVVRIR